MKALAPLLMAAAGACSGMVVAHSPPLAIRVQENRLVDAAGHAVQLRGVNFSAFESVAIFGWSPADPSGAQAGQAEGPRWKALSRWGANAVRLPLNEASWLGYGCVDSDGATRNPDPGKNYQAAVTRQVKQAIASGMYVILDLHWAAPGKACPMLQTQMADADNAPAFWRSVAAAFKDNPAVLFELYNEPYFDGLGFGEREWPALRDGAQLSFYPATSATNHWKRVALPWRTAGTQQLLDAIRASGAHNVVLVGGTGWCNDLSGWLDYAPRDPLRQLAAAWHPYPPQQTVASASVAAAGARYAIGDTLTLAEGSGVYAPATLTVTAVGSGGSLSGLRVLTGGRYLQTRLPGAPIPIARSSGKGSGGSVKVDFHNLAANWSMPGSWPAVQAIARKVPVVFTEIGEHNTAGTQGAPFLEQLLPWADANGISYLGWTWDVWQNPDDVLIKDADGTPTDGYGVYFRQHLQCRAGTTSANCR
jgi:hypothetical protein